MVKDKTYYLERIMAYEQVLETARANKDDQTFIAVDTEIAVMRIRLNELEKGK